ncbi:MAG TPA: heparan-alpha-glucosaminide N-acetyltransferase domain-containing protein [Bacteroidota bacterium]|nr:heparan-alpha-glucosaminide N-acetyltransferase domain-containing protein [Bacteroidota bacterium]
MQDSGATLSPKPRLDSVDFLRGAVMIIMALDHVRDFTSYYRFDPLDFSQTNPALFLTRWITHFCAPVFVFLAGTGAFLAGSRGKTKPELAKFLLSRGIWLIFLEFTIVRFGWLFNLDYSLSFGQVIWAIGVSMVVLAGLIFFSIRTIAVFGVGMVVLHNFLDPVTPAQLGIFGWPWQIIHSGGVIAFAPHYYYIALYPVVPWIGVMAAGYAFGTILLKEEMTRRKILLRLGAGMILAFIILRAVNIYGDPHPWSSQSTFIFTFLSFIKCEKYPPSLLYLLMTLGPAIALLPAMEKVKGKFASVVIVYGRVPLFYYVIHIFLIHTVAIALAYFTIHDIRFLLLNVPPGSWGNNYGFSLPIVYLVWISIVASLYPACKWFAGVKRRRKDVWLSYI